MNEFPDDINKYFISKRIVKEAINRERNTLIKVMNKPGMDKEWFVIAVNSCSRLLKELGLGEEVE
jgi:hypothetical protein